MKSLFILLLLFTASCNKDEPVADEGISDSQTLDHGGGTSGDSSTGDPSGGTTAPQTKTQEFMNLINSHRMGMGLKALIHDEDVGIIATTHSENMATGLTPFGHTGFSARCSEARSVLGGGNLCAENVAMGQKTVQAAFTAWLNSSGHRANIEQPRATHTGFGYKQNTSGTYYWTQIFIEKN
ncbi:MAG: CAP domain-containing protein [Bdellovibrionales bacterium]|nr:CAP domain-containing protein [Bdellovibrionales bacterium]